MRIMRIRVVGDETRAETLMNMLHTMDGVARVEEMPLPRAGLGGNGDAVSHLEVAVADGAAHRIRAFMAGAALLMDASAEFVDRFGIEGPLADRHAPPARHPVEPDQSSAADGC